MALPHRFGRRVSAWNASGARIPGVRCVPSSQSDGCARYMTSSPRGYRLLDETSAIRATRSFFTSDFGRGLSTGKWSDPFVPENPFVAVVSAGITDPLCGK
jgi:hypothetical protein